MSEISLSQPEELFELKAERLGKRVRDLLWSDIQASRPSDAQAELVLLLASTGDDRAFDLLDASANNTRNAIALYTDPLSSANHAAKRLDVLTAFPNPERIEQAWRNVAEIDETYQPEGYVSIYKASQKVLARDGALTAGTPDPEEALIRAIDGASQPLKNDGYNIFVASGYADALMEVGTIRREPLYYQKALDVLQYDKSRYLKNKQADEFTFKAVRQLEQITDTKLKETLTTFTVSVLKQSGLSSFTAVTYLLPHLTAPQKDDLLLDLVQSGTLMTDPAESIYLADVAEAKAWLKPRQIAKRRKIAVKKLEKHRSYGSTRFTDDFIANRLIELGYDDMQLMYQATQLATETYNAGLSDEHRLNIVNRITKYIQMNKFGLTSEQACFVRDGMKDSDFRFLANTQILQVDKDPGIVDEIEEYFTSEKPYRKTLETDNNQFPTLRRNKYSVRFLHEALGLPFAGQIY